MPPVPATVLTDPGAIPPTPLYTSMSILLVSDLPEGVLLVVEPLVAGGPAHLHRALPASYTTG